MKHFLTPACQTEPLCKIQATEFRPPSQTYLRILQQDRRTFLEVNMWLSLWLRLSRILIATSAVLLYTNPYEGWENNKCIHLPWKNGRKLQFHNCVRKSRYPTYFSMLMPHNLCCFYFCNMNWAQWRFWMGRIWGWNSCQTEYALEAIQTVTLFPHFVIKCIRKTSSSATLHCFQNSAWASYTSYLP